MQMIVPTPDGISVYKQIRIYTEAVQETNTVKTVLNGTILELVNPIVNDYLAANECYISEYDLEDSFLTPDPDEPRTLNDNCNIVIFWMRGCPPCYTAKQQLKDMKTQYPNLTLTFVEIQDADPSDEGDEHSIGMTAAKLLYPEAYAFAAQCGPPPPAPYQVIDCENGMMPAVIAIYRDDLFVRPFVACIPQALILFLPTFSLIRAALNYIGASARAQSARRRSSLTMARSRPIRYGLSQGQGRRRRSLMSRPARASSSIMTSRRAKQW